MKVLGAALVLAMAVPLAAQTVPPSEVVNAATLRSTGNELLQKASAARDGVASKVLLTRPDGSEQLAVRVKSGQGEWHHDFADVLIVLEGQGQIVTGGEIVDGKEIAPGEIRGDGVQGGKVQPFRAGDTIRIEAQVPHQLLLAPGHTIRYFAVKVKTQH
jgi:mannose-6-phosphate isomerase-like protein (cupin superfamily)